MFRSIILSVMLLCASVSFLYAQVNQEWVARYNGPISSDDVAVDVAVDNSGNVYVTGYSASILGQPYNYDYLTIKYNSAGIQQWAARYNGPGNSEDKATTIAIDSDGNVYVTGWSIGSGTQTDYTTVKYNTTGHQLWVARYNGPGNAEDRANSLGLDNDGNVYVAGASWGGSGTNLDYATIKYDTNGNQLWVARYNGPGNLNDEASSLALDNHGNVYVTGKSTGGLPYPSYDYATIKYDASGNQLWVARGDDGLTECANSIAVDRNGNVYVTGDGSHDYATVKYNTSGIQQWMARYVTINWDIAYFLVVDGEGNVYVSGSSGTVKYNSVGVQQWVVSIGSGYANSMALDVYGNVYIASQEGSPLTNYNTFKYNNSGIQQWEMNYIGPSNGDVAVAIAIDNSNDVYVTGFSQGIGTNADYATIKYHQTPFPVVSINLTPINPPIIIPAEGGWFTYDINAHNDTTVAQTFQLWNKIRDANNVYTQVFGPITRTVQGSGNPIRTLMQTISGSQPAGNYLYISYVGLYSWVIVDSSFFPFTKSALSDGGAWVGETTCTGDFFEEYGENGDVDVRATHASPLHPNISPNPFNPTTTIRFDLQQPAQVTLEVFDINGRVVGDQHVEPLQAGSHEIQFDGSGLPSGVYIYRLTAGVTSANGKMVLLK
ncbi:MAG: SBBP repeat-containing protein [bacterium]|nr:SBBP repeat-containing protein [bacterium]